MEDYEALPDRASALEDLRTHWGSIYLVNVEQGTMADRWTAQRRVDGTILEAGSAWELRTKMRHDYQPERGTL